MNKKRWKDRFTFVLIPDANRSIKSIRFAAYWIIIAPLLLLICIIALFVWQLWVQRHFTQTISGLHQDVSHHKEEYAELEHRKDQTIKILEQEMIKMAEQAEELRTQMLQIEQLEQEIRSHAASTSRKDNPVTIQALKALEVPPAHEELQSSSYSAKDGNDSDFLAYIRQEQEGLASAEQQAEQLTGRLMEVKQMLDEKWDRMEATPSIWPVQTKLVTSDYGYRSDPFTGIISFHDGMDMDGSLNDPVFAAARGTVEETGTDSGMGKYIRIRHGYGLQTVYMHLNRILVSEGEEVEKGENIGLVGSTGRSTGTHLHYTVLKNGAAVDPSSYLP
ncbi:peptidoglycan DD-metalloendopeptidase family protein [Marinicrinis lubricantis]|uniref:Peptidoglycan DD-metalloendopeptidase family protein n=1 Tax=Marinicrinis lubricantis TaxID=2086470 RepID=A0ABW1IRH9_9BACL